jgi:hypothetical protein
MNAYRILLGKSEGKRLLINLKENGRMILKWTLEKDDLDMDQIILA